MKKILIFTFTLTLFLTSCSEEEKEIPQKYFQTALVETGSITNSQSYVGYTDSFQSIALAPKVWWKIISLSKKVWDPVKAGEVVATLDAIEAKTGYNSSNEIIKNLETLKVSTSQMFDSQILVMEEKIKQAQIGIEISNIGAKWNEIWVSETKDTVENQLKTIESQIESAQTAIESSILQLENTKNILSQKENDIYSNSKSAITNANILANNIIDFLDNIFWITPANTYKKKDYDIYLWAKKLTVRNQTEWQLEKIIIHFWEIQKNPLEDYEEIQKNLEIYHSFFTNDIRELLKNAYSVFENTVENPYLWENIIQEYKTKISQMQAQNEQIILSVSWNYFLGLKGSLDTIKNFEKEKKSSLDMLEKQVELAKKQKETLKNSKTQISSLWNTQIIDIHTKNEIAKKQTELSENSLKEVKASLESLKKQKQASLSEIDTQISQVISWKSDAGVMIENGKVTSLIDGIITKKFAEVWSIIWAWTPIFMVSNDKNIKIEVTVNDDTLNTLQIWDSIQTEIDGIENIISWTISNIFPSKDTITKKTTVEIKIENPNIKIGSYAKVYFLNTTENVGLIIPNSAIVSKYMLPQVFILENGVAKLTHIKILSQNDSFSQIEWLQIWTHIITNGKENISDGEILTP